METNSNMNREEFDFRIARKKVIKLRSFYVHSFIYSIALAIFILKNYYAVSFDFFPFKYLNYIVIIIWSSLFISSAIDLFSYNKIFGREWEARKMKNILDKRQKQQKWE